MENSSATKSIVAGKVVGAMGADEAGGHFMRKPVALWRERWAGMATSNMKAVG